MPIDREISSDEKIKQNIEIGLLYACKKNPSKSCHAECPEYEKCYGDDGGIFVDDRDINRLLYAGFR